MPNQTIQDIKRQHGGSDTEPVPNFLSNWNSIIQFDVAIDPANIGANSDLETVVNFPAAIKVPAQTPAVVPAAGDFIAAMAPAALEAGLVVKSLRVIDANTFGLTLRNVTGAGIDGASRTWAILIVKTKQFNVI